MALNCVQVKSGWLDLMGQSLVAWAVQSGNFSAVTALTNRGVDANAGLATTPLHIAADRADLPTLQHLLGLNNLGLAANPLIGDSQGRTPLQCCVLQSDSNADTMQAHALLSMAEKGKRILPRLNAYSQISQ